MMVEAGGTEKAWSYYEAGAPKVTEEVIADGLEACQDLDPRVDRPPARARREGRRARPPLAVRVASSTTATTSPAGRGRLGADALAEANTDRRQDRAQRRHRRAPRPRSSPSSAGERRAFAGREQARSRPPSARSPRRSSASASSTRASASTAAAPPTSARCPPRSASSRPPTAPACSSGARPRCSTSSPSACPAWTRCSTPSAPRTRSATCTTTTCRPTPTARPAAWAAPSAARSATACSPSGPCCRSCPSLEEFPYTLRLVSEVLSSNGSTSMGSVCASSLSLMDAGVPIKAPVAGIAMGLVYDDGKYITLTDILGAEDAFGDMDFKVAGTAEFVTALQLDTKIDGLPADVLAAALQQAREARLADPRGHERRHRRAPRRGRRDRARRSSASRSRSTRSARSSGPRARSSTPSSRRPAPTSASTTTAWSAR